MEKTSKFDLWALLSIMYGSCRRTTRGVLQDDYQHPRESKDASTRVTAPPKWQLRIIFPMDTLDCHMVTQFMKAVDTLKENNAGNRAGGGGRWVAADEQRLRKGWGDRFGKRRNLPKRSCAASFHPIIMPGNQVLNLRTTQDAFWRGEGMELLYNLRDKKI